MNAYKKTVMALALGLIVTAQMHAANGNFSQLDQAGINIMIELKTISDDITNSILSASVKKTEKPTPNFAEWTFLLKTNVKSYVENYSAVMNVRDKELMNSLNLLLATNATLIQKFNAVQNYKATSKKLDENAIHLLEEDLLHPFVYIKNDIEKTILPALEKQSYYVSADSKGKAKEVLIRAFELLKNMAGTMTVYTRSFINSLRT
jgi:hypothetical protein